MNIVVCISGASGAIYPKRLFNALHRARQGTDTERRIAPKLHVSWVTSKNAEDIWQTELGEELPVDESQQADRWFRRWDNDDFTAPFASGSSAPDAVIVAPCSMSTLARVANGGGTDLISRTCEVALKERKPLILIVRETPLSRVHMVNMLAAHDAGAIILPAIPSFYGLSPEGTLNDAIDTVVCRALDRANLQLPLVSRWGQHA